MCSNIRQYLRPTLFIPLNYLILMSKVISIILLLYYFPLFQTTCCIMERHCKLCKLKFTSNELLFEHIVDHNFDTGNLNHCVF